MFECMLEPPAKYCTISRQVKQIINKHWSILECDPNLNHLAVSRPHFCFRRGRNIRDFVVSSMYKEPTQTNWLSLQLYGNYRFDTKIFNHPHSGKKYNIKECINCLSTHVVRVLKCPCGLMYVGQTKRNLKVRVAEHKAAIRNENMDYAISRHYREKKHGSATTLKFIGIEILRPNPRGGNLINQLLRGEAFWIHELNTIEPHGLNETLHLSPSL
ncbi:uncharacterized protein LOC123959274 [Micropterus dolomieu]|uniref:uncharacterized protein LOC123959274 n=1 Tax=Micropterus dolomieu TaxID=147949 RepID=UPI001E8DE32F|nr:uncharacterized protein LOC123959274 [Micropterus dolomieu]